MVLRLAKESVMVTVLLLTILTGQSSHSIVAEYINPQSCEAAGQAHVKAFEEQGFRRNIIVYSCSQKLHYGKP